MPIGNPLTFPLFFQLVSSQIPKPTTVDPLSRRRWCPSGYSERCRSHLAPFSLNRYANKDNGKSTFHGSFFMTVVRAVEIWISGVSDLLVILVSGLLRLLRLLRLDVGLGSVNRTNTRTDDRILKYKI